jgi:Holliday junction resolvase RusA-like endonuclease
MNTWKITVPLVPPSRNSKDAKDRWRYTETKAEWKYEVWALCKEAKIKPCSKIRTEIAIYFHENRRRDHDNYGIVNKLVNDGLVAASVIIDDNPEYLEKPSYPDLLVDKENPRTEVTITRIE